jgi:hypothetical protein
MADLLAKRLRYERENPRPMALVHAERMIVQGLNEYGFGPQHQVTRADGFEIAVDDLLIRVQLADKPEEPERWHTPHREPHEVQPDPTPQRCPECRGAKNVPAVPEETYKGRVITVICPTCNGTGTEVRGEDE